MAELYAWRFGVSAVAVRLGWMVRNPGRGPAHAQAGDLRLLRQPRPTARAASPPPSRPEVHGFEIVYAASRGGERVFDMEPARRLLGFEAARALARGAAVPPADWMTSEPEAAPPLRRLLALAWDYRGVCAARVRGADRRRWRSGWARWRAAASPIDVVRRGDRSGGAAPCAGRSGLRRPPAGRPAPAADRGRRGRAAAGDAARARRLRHRARDRPADSRRPGARAARARVRQAAAARLRVLPAQRQRLDHQPRHRRRAVAALVHRRRAAAGRAAGVHAGRLRRLHGARSRRADRRPAWRRRR